MQMNDLQTALDRAKIGLMQTRDSAFFTTIAFSLKHIWDDTQRTAYVDGVHMGWNPEFFMKMTPDERIGVMVHEACHMAFDHIGLQLLHPDWCPDLLNQAADHVINLMLKERGFQLPHPHLAEDRFKGMHTEQIYKILADEAAQGKPMPQLPMADLRPPKPGDEPGAGSGPNPGTGMTPEQLTKHIQGIIVRASLQSKMAGDKPGTIPGEIELYLDNLFNPKLPWTTLLRRFLTEFSKNDYSWKKPNRRFFPDHYLPSLYSMNLTELDFYVDISGSVEDYQFQIFVSEIAGVMKFMKPKKLTIIQFDTRIQHVNEVRSIQELMQVKFHGRGGTSVREVMERISKEKKALSLIFTDGEFHWPKNPPKQRILWLINDNPRLQPTFGHTVHFSTKDYTK